MVPGGLPHASASPPGQGRRVAQWHGQNGARVDGPGAAVGWRPTRHLWGVGVEDKNLVTDRVHHWRRRVTFLLGGAQVGHGVWIVGSRVVMSALTCSV
jgi:hypothetical protein